MCVYTATRNSYNKDCNSELMPQKDTRTVKDANNEKKREETKEKGTGKPEVALDSRNQPLATMD